MTTEYSPAGARLRGLPLLLLIGGVLGTLSSCVLTYDRIRGLEDPLFSPGCNINTVLSCGDVMTTWQGNLLGFPNMLLGVAGFAALAGLGLALVAGAVFPRWLWRGVWAGVAAGFAFTVWLIGQCLFVIGALCPWCMVVWAVMIPLFWYVTRHLSRPGSALRAVPHWLVPAFLYLLVVALIFSVFGPSVFGSSVFGIRIL
ncbi:vitamin K epoxide reductase family protein [Streptomyces sp. NBC_00536]|uniref:vitamin K epoxide reductase family protein n=1 Tax=Streptomyces sp. NBC_00536 TaxID=2975769 RepID=UPI002E7FD549|nr:vitamin K epoxide reductase family protein [Streptomyces sp. NBC_00536]WUC78999.1 vitamin K epoxide reductase family protein [Streptomyces sp. NBC_00536]